MGRKGVSKRKPPKSKSPKTLAKGENGVVSGATSISKSPVGQSIGKGEAITVDKGRQKK